MGRREPPGCHFRAMRNRETYATSGTRPIVRFFAGDYETDLCDDPDALDEAYALGVPMGGVLERKDGDAAPRFFVSAQRDQGTDLHPANPSSAFKSSRAGLMRTVRPMNELSTFWEARHKARCRHEQLRCDSTGARKSLYRLGRPNVSPRRVRVLLRTCLRDTQLPVEHPPMPSGGRKPFSESCAAEADAANVLANEMATRVILRRFCCTNSETDPFYSPTIRERAWTSPIWLSTTR